MIKQLRTCFHQSNKQVCHKNKHLMQTAEWAQHP